MLNRFSGLEFARRDLEGIVKVESSAPRGRAFFLLRPLRCLQGKGRRQEQVGTILLLRLASDYRSGSPLAARHNGRFSTRGVLTSAIDFFLGYLGLATNRTARLREISGLRQTYL